MDDAVPSPKPEIFLSPPRAPRYERYLEEKMAMILCTPLEDTSITLVSDFSISMTPEKMQPSLATPNLQGRESPLCGSRKRLSYTINREPESTTPSPPANAAEGDLLPAGDVCSLEERTAADASYVVCSAATRDQCSLGQPSAALDVSFTVSTRVEALESSRKHVPQDDAGIPELKRDASFVVRPAPAACEMVPEARPLRRSYTVEQESRREPAPSGDEPKVDTSFSDCKEEVSAQNDKSNPSKTSRLSFTVLPAHTDETSAPTKGPAEESTTSEESRLITVDESSVVSGIPPAVRSKLPQPRTKVLKRVSSPQARKAAGAPRAAGGPRTASIPVIPRFTAASSGACPTARLQRPVPAATTRNGKARPALTRGQTSRAPVQSALTGKPRCSMAASVASSSSALRGELAPKLVKPTLQRQTRLKLAGEQHPKPAAELRPPSRLVPPRSRGVGAQSLPAPKRTLSKAVTTTHTDTIAASTPVRLVVPPPNNAEDCLPTPIKKTTA